MTVAASAAGENTPCVVDHANLLSASELAGLTRDLQAIARKYGVEVAVVTTESSEGLSHRRYAEKIYEEYGYGLGADADGVLLLVVIPLNIFCLSPYRFCPLLCPSLHEMFPWYL